MTGNVFHDLMGFWGDEVWGDEVWGVDVIREFWGPDEYAMGVVLGVLGL